MRGALARGASKRRGRTGGPRHPQQRCRTRIRLSKSTGSPPELFCANGPGLRSARRSWSDVRTRT
eukprot:9509702-Alexandrium_andersonii.AAC.1